MKLKFLFAASAAVMGCAVANAQTAPSMTSFIQTVEPGVSSKVSVNLEDNASVLYTFEALFETTAGLTLNAVLAGPDASAFTPTDNYGGIWMMLDENDFTAVPNGEFMQLDVTLSAGTQCGTITITPTDGCGDEAAEELDPSLRPAPITITVVASDYALGTNGYSSFSSANATKVTGATAYYVAVDGDVAKLTAVEGNVVPANTGVILKGTEGANVTFAPNADVVAGANELSASVSGATVSGVHVLATKSGETGFYKYTGTEIGAGKAYLEGVTLSRVLFDTETGIENVELNNIEAIFNLQGQKLNETKKGINIVNGKKVMF